MFYTFPKEYLHFLHKTKPFPVTFFFLSPLTCVFSHPRARACFLVDAATAPLPLPPPALSWQPTERVCCFTTKRKMEEKIVEAGV